jgi:hypothetical protein
MTDRNGKLITVGARCRFLSCTRKAWLYGTVRVVPTMGACLGTARVDDGDPANDDLATNGFSVTSWVEREDIEVVEAVAAGDDGTAPAHVWTPEENTKLRAEVERLRAEVERERAAMVAWLERQGGRGAWTLVDAIRQGEHRKGEP